MPASPNGNEKDFSCRVSDHPGDNGLQLTLSGCPERSPSMTEVTFASAVGNARQSCEKFPQPFDNRDIEDTLLRKPGTQHLVSSSVVDDSEPPLELPLHCNEFISELRVLQTCAESLLEDCAEVSSGDGFNLRPTLYDVSSLILQIH